MAQASEEVPDFELIRRMAEHEADFAGAREAWGIFYLRHHAFLLAVCNSDYRYLLGVEGVRDLVQDSLLRAFDRATTFDCVVDCDATLQHRRSRGWLVRIAENIVRDRYRGQPDICFVDEEEIEVLGGVWDQSDEDAQLPENRRLQMLTEALALLSESEQAVLRTTMVWWQPERQHQRMPHKAIEELSRQIGKSPENVRQIRLRALKKLQQFLNDCFQA